MRKDVDDAADGTVDVRWTWSYDDAGRMLREERDVGEPAPDGVPEAVREWTYGADGRLATERVDEPADGVPEREARHRWFSAGHLIGTDIEIDAWDCCPDGGHGCGWPCGADGTTDRRELSVETLDGRPLYRAHDGGDAGDPGSQAKPDGVLDGWRSWTYDHANRVLSTVTRSGDGRVSGAVTHRYDVHGDLVETTWAGESATPSPQRAVYERDAVGNPLSETRYYGGAEEPGTRTTWTYACWE